MYRLKKCQYVVIKSENIICFKDIGVLHLTIKVTASLNKKTLVDTKFIVLMVLPWTVKGWRSSV